MNNNSNKQYVLYQQVNPHTPNRLIENFRIIRNYSLSVTIIFLIVFGISITYALLSTDIYQSEAVLKITPPEGNILKLPLLEEMGTGNQSETFIANEIHTLNNITIRERVAEVIIDSFNTIQEIDKFSVLIKTKSFQNSEKKLKNRKSIASLLERIVTIQQVPQLHFIQISCASPSPFEAALIANAYANVYREFNLLDNRKQVTRVREFLEKRKEEEFAELKNAENEYKIYQLRGGAIELDAQAKSLITTITELESKTNSVAIDLAISSQTLNQFKKELKRQDLSISSYLESKSSEPLILKLQTQIAEIEAQKQLALIDPAKNSTKKALIREYEGKIESLTNALKEKHDVYEDAILSSSPEEIKLLMGKIFEEEVRNNSLKASLDELRIYLQDYSNRFDKLPERSIDLARLERQRQAHEKLYLLLEEKFQEALINEQATSGNVLILNSARVPDNPYKPFRLLIILIGLALGTGLGIGYAIVRNMFDRSISSPDDLEHANIEYLTSVPEVKNYSENGKQTDPETENKFELMAKNAINSLRTLIRYANVSTPAKTILIASSVPGEGKSFISLNLAKSFAQANVKTLIIDCDLRKPSQHRMLGQKRTPGFTDYLVTKHEYKAMFNEPKFENLYFRDLVQKTDIDNLYLVTPGTLPPNPTEILDSKEMKSLIERFKNIFDVVIIDSPPLLTFTDGMILSRVADRTILVASANKSEMAFITKSVNQLKKFETHSFIGVVLNRYDLKNDYGSYYSYSYNFPENAIGKSKKTIIKKILDKSTAKSS